MATINELKVGDIKERIVAIVRFGPSGHPTDGFKPGEYFQVTIDPKKISPSGLFVRFGDAPGDEIVGWQRCAALTVIEILGEWGYEDDKPLLEYGKQDGITMMIASAVKVE